MVGRIRFRRRSAGDGAGSGGLRGFPRSLARPLAAVVAVSLSALPLASAGAARSLPRPLFSVDGPASLRADPDDVARGEWFVMVEGAGGADGPAIEGWSFGLVLSVPPGDPSPRIAAFDLEGTGAEPALEGGSVRNVITAAGGEPAVASRVAMPAEMALSPGTRHRIARIVLEVDVPPRDVLASVRFRFSGDVVADGAPVPLLVRAGGEESEDVISSPFSVSLAGSVYCSQRALGFALESIDSPAPFDGIVGGESAAGEVDVPVREGPPGEIHVFPSIVSDTSRDLAVQGWSLSIEIDGEADCVEATRRGTFAERVAGGFSKTECIDPERNDGRRGLVTATVLTFADGFALPPVGTYSVVDATIRAAAPQGLDDQVARLRFADGLTGSGQPVRNVLTVQGESTVACNQEEAALTIRFRADGIHPFIRGDANADGVLNISDPVTLLRNQFHGDARVLCDDAGDANDDGDLDIADAIFIFGYLFLGTRPPPPPFPAADLDPTPDRLDCRPPPAAGSRPAAVQH